MKVLTINDPALSNLSECFKRNITNGNIKMIKGVSKAILSNIVYSDHANNIYGVRMNNNPLI